MESTFGPKAVGMNNPVHILMLSNETFGTIIYIHINIRDSALPGAAETNKRH